MKEWIEEVKVKRLIIVFVFAVVVSIFMPYIYAQKTATTVDDVSRLVDIVTSKLFIMRFLFCFAFSFFVGLHFVYNVRKMYEWIFRCRWGIAGVILILLTVFEIHGDSMSLYDAYVQPSKGAEFVEPIFGTPRSIRSDEWVVDTPSILAASYGDDAYEKYNEVLRGGDTLNIVSGVYINYATIGKNPTWFAYKILDVEKAFCFCWNFRILFTFLICVELFYIITRRKKLISVLGGCFVTMSTFFLWWGFPIYITNSAAALVCIYYFLIARKKKLKILYAIGVAVATANFVVNLYPAWQVPVAYMIIAFLVWLVHDYWKLIKSMDKIDWGIFVGALLFCMSLVIANLYDLQEYTTAIMDTVYPGTRFDRGGLAIYKLMYYGQAFFYSVKDIGNASENAVFFSLFPLPMIFAFLSQVKAKKKDWLVVGLLLVSVFLLIYTTIGVPEAVAKYTLMSYSTPFRAVDILGHINVLLLVIVMGRVRKPLNCKVWISIIIGALLSYTCVWASKRYIGEYMTLSMIILSSIVIIVVTILMLTKLNKKVFIILSAGVIIFFSGSAVLVRPVMKGFASYFSKPLSKEIAEIMEKDEDSTWITVGDDIVLQSYAVACGAPTLNSVNIYPNFDLWKQVDPEGQYNDVYNRYAHISVDLIENQTYMELIQADWLKLYLSYDDMTTLGIDYVLSRKDFDDTPSLEQIYHEDGIYIYQVDEKR